MKKLWIDDERKPPEGWLWSKDYDDAVYILSLKWVFEWVSFDHDLGEGKDGYDVVKWIAEENIWPSIRNIAVHTHNPVGAKNICGVVNRYGPYSTECIWTPYGTYRHWAMLGEYEQLQALSDGR